MKELDKLEHFNSLDKGAIIANVLMYIDDRLQSNWRNNIEDPLPYILTAVEKLLEGKHAWDVTTTPDMIANTFRRDRRVRAAT